MTQVYERERQLHREVAQAVESALPEVEVLAVELGGSELIWVFVDHPSGVDHALCERVTRVLSDHLTRYTINVSSPGFERPLRTPAHFAGVVGRRVSVKTREAVAGRARFRGEIATAGEREFTLVTGSGERVSVPYDAIARCNVIDEGR
jgi:ribosome maturation factor RimP